MTGYVLWLVTFCSGDVLLQVTFCSGDVLLQVTFCRGTVFPKGSAADVSVRVLSEKY